MSGCGHVPAIQCSLSMPRPLVAEEKEGVIAAVVQARNIDGASQRAAEIRSMQGIDSPAEGIGGVVGLIAVEAKEIAMQRVCSALGDYIHHRPRVSSVAGAVVAGLYAEFLK